MTKLLRRLAVDPDDTVAMMVGPEIMMRFTAQELTGLGVPADQIYLSMERNMKCGLGYCGHCQLGPVLICRDGPVFRYNDSSSLLTTREM